MVEGRKRDLQHSVLSPFAVYPVLHTHLPFGQPTQSCLHSALVGQSESVWHASAIFIAEIKHVEKLG